MQPDKAGIPRIAKSMGHEIIGRKQSSEEFHRSPPAIDSSYERKGGAMFSYFCSNGPQFKNGACECLAL